MFMSILSGGSLLKERLCSTWSKSFRLRVGPNFEGIHPRKEAARMSQKLFPFVKMVKKHGGIHIHLKGYGTRRCRQQRFSGLYISNAKSGENIWKMNFFRSGKSQEFYGWSGKFERTWKVREKFVREIRK